MATADGPATPSAEEVDMREEEVLACAFGAWYETFRSITFRSEVVALPEDFVQFLLADGICVPAGAQADDRSSDSSWGEGGCEGAESDHSSEPFAPAEANFPELEGQIDTAIARLGGSALPKLNWSAPKDAQWLHGSLRCTSAREVFTLLKASDFVAHDLCHSFDHCSTSRTRPDEFTLVLRRWCNLHESNEFRCFVSGCALLAISQRQTSGLFEHLADQGEADALRREIQSFFEQHLRERFPLARYAFDAYVGSPPQRRVRLVDFTPWGPTTDPCLFDWPELQGLAAQEQPAAPELRVVREEAERRAKPESYSQLPLELAQLSAGEGIEELLRKADQVLERKGCQSAGEGS